jgi:hypothetical protein
MARLMIELFVLDFAANRARGRSRMRVRIMDCGGY